MRKSAFALCDDHNAYIGYTSGALWNGWATPYFTLEEAQRLQADFNKGVDTPMLYDVAKDEFRIQYDGDDEPYIWKGEDIQTVDGITTGEVYASVADAAEAIGVTKTAMSWALTGRSKSCKGKRFCFIHQIVEHLNEIAEVNRAREAKVIAHDAMVEKQKKIKAVKDRIAKHEARIEELQSELKKEMDLMADATFELRELENN